MPTTNAAAGTITTVSGTISINTLTQSGTLYFPIAGATAFGKIAVGNSFVLNGTLTATTTGGYTPPNSTTFQVLTYPSSSGAFTTKNLTYPGGGQFTDSYTSTALTLTAGNANCTTLPANAVSWYRAEGNAVDSVDGNNGTASGGVSYATGEIGQAFSFDGVNGSVNVPMSSNLQLTNVTLEFWMKGDPSNTLNTCCQGLVGTLHGIHDDAKGVRAGACPSVGVQKHQRRGTLRERRPR